MWVLAVGMSVPNFFMSELLEVSGNKVVCMVNYDGGENITKLNEEYVMEIEIELEYEEWVKLAFAGIIFNSFFLALSGS